MRKGNTVPFMHGSQTAANVLGFQNWGDSDTTNTITESISTELVVTEDLGLDQTSIIMEGLLWDIQKLKRGKAAGPDGIPMESSLTCTKT